MTEISMLNQTIEVRQFNLGLLKTKKFFLRKKSIHHKKMKPECGRKLTYDEIQNSKEKNTQFF